MMSGLKDNDCFNIFCGSIKSLRVAIEIFMSNQACADMQENDFLHQKKLSKVRFMQNSC